MERVTLFRGTIGQFFDQCRSVDLLLVHTLETRRALCAVIVTSAGGSDDIERRVAEGNMQLRAYDCGITLRRFCELTPRAVIRALQDLLDEHALVCDDVSGLDVKIMVEHFAQDEPSPVSAFIDRYIGRIEEDCAQTAAVM